MILDELGVKDSVAECDTDWTAAPVREMVTVGLVALLVTVTLPFRVPEADGANVTFKTTELPAANIKPEDTPPMLNPAPESVTFEMETLEAPLFVNVTDRRLLLPTVIFPKFRFVALAVSWPEAWTVSVAALLVTVPCELLTATANCDPLSAEVAAGVV